MLFLMVLPFAVSADNAEQEEAGEEHGRVTVIDTLSKEQIEEPSAKVVDPMRVSSARMAVMSALTDDSRESVGFYIDFAPDSSVMTAKGKKTLNLVASAIELIPHTPSFEITVSKNIRTRSRSAERLALDRAYAIAAHLRSGKRLKNNMTLMVGYKSASGVKGAFKSHAGDKLNVFFSYKRAS